MINKINSMDARSSKNSSAKAAKTFTGSAQIVKKEMYAVTDTFAKLVEKRTNKAIPLTEALSKLLRRPVDELKKALNIEDAEKFNAKFKLDSEDLMNKKFKNSLTEFLKEKNIINKDNEFQSLPAKMLVLKKGDAHIDDLIAGADRIVLHNGVDAKDVEGKRVIIRNLDNKMDVKGDYVNVKDSILNHVTSETFSFGKNLTAKTATAQNGGVSLGGEANNVETLTAKGDISADNLTSKTTTAHEGWVVLCGEANNVKTLTAEKSIIAENLTSKKVLSKDGAVRLNGEANKVEALTAKLDIDARCLASKTATSQEGYVYLRGEGNNVETLMAKWSIDAENLTAKTATSQDCRIVLRGEANKVETLTAKGNIYTYNLTAKDVTAQRFVPSGDTFVSGKIDADTSVSFKLKNLYNKSIKNDKS